VSEVAEPEAEKAAPPRAPSPARVPIDGWTCRHRVASLWRPTTHSADGNLMGGSQLLPARSLCGGQGPASSTRIPMSMTMTNPIQWRRWLFSRTTMMTRGRRWRTAKAMAQVRDDSGSASTLTGEGPSESMVSTPTARRSIYGPAVWRSSLFFPKPDMGEDRGSGTTLMG
jgi:hypothetical protein